ncbi:MAG TPA: hypothetical protein VF346_01730 [Bacteroidales bacterium]
MKKLIAICFLVSFFLSLNAQSKNSLVFGDAVVKYKKMQNAGAVLSIIGGATFIAGNIMYRKIYNDFGINEPPGDKVKTYRQVMLGGVGLLAVGVPLWTIGRIKEKHIEIGLVRFNSLYLANGIGLKISF